MNYALHMLIYFQVYLILAVSLNIMVGYCGLFSLAHAAFWAVGAYGYALLTFRGHFDFIEAIVGASLIAAALSSMLSIVAWRLRGDMFVLGSLAVQSVIAGAIYNWHDLGHPLGSWRNLTNGPYGIRDIQPPRVLGHIVEGIGEKAVVFALTTMIALLVVWWLTRSPWGRALKAMRDDEIAAKGLGLNTPILKLQGIALGCSLAGMAGAMFAAYVGYIDPSIASLDQGLLMLTMILLGGVGTFRGPVLGTIVLLAMPEVLRSVRLSDVVAANVRSLVFGVLLVILVHLRPRGLAGRYELR